MKSYAIGTEIEKRPKLAYPRVGEFARKAKKAKLKAAQTMEKSRGLTHDCNTGRMAKST